MVYESALLFAVAFFAAWLFQFAAGRAVVDGWQRTAMQVYLAAVLAAYFLWCWLRGGQTLAMKAWGIRLVAPGKTRVPAITALVRLLLAALFVGAFCAALATAIVLAACEGGTTRLHTCATLPALLVHNNWLVSLVALTVSGAGLGWAFVDRDRQFLHDRLAGTRLVLVRRELEV